MSYNMLCRKSQGKFDIILDAVTRGIKRVPKNDVQRVNIVRVCEQLLEYIMSNSESPKKMLTMSANLIYGTVLIHRQQHVDLQQEICKCIFSIERPKALLSLEDDQEEDGLPKPMKEKQMKGKKKEKAVEKPEPGAMQQVMQTELEINGNVTDPIHITLREEVAPSSWKPVVEEGFGDEEQIDLQLALPSYEDWISPLLELLAPPVAEIADVEMEKRRAQSPVLAVESPGKRRRLEDGAAHAHIFPEVNIVQRGAILRDEEQPVNVDLNQGVISSDLPMSKRLVSQTATGSADTAITTVQKPCEAAMPPPPPVPSGHSRRRVIRTPPAQQRRPFNNNIEIPSQWRRRNINRDINNDAFRLGNRSIPVNRRSMVFSTPTQHQDPRDILREIFSDESAGLPLDSVPAREMTCVINQHKTGLAPLTEQAGISGYEPPIPEMQPISEMQPSLTEPMSRIEKQEELNQSDVSAEYRQTFEAQLSRVNTSTPLPLDRESKRHSILLTTIRNRFTENGNKPLKIEQLCVPPNRFKMATTFCALLSLEAKQHIIMQSAPGTNELDTITPGPRLWDL